MLNINGRRLWSDNFVSCGKLNVYREKTFLSSFATNKRFLHRFTFLNFLFTKVNCQTLNGAH